MNYRHGTGNKYNAKRTTVDGETFDSKHEAYRWIELRYMERAGLITDLHRQVPFELIPAQKEDGKVVERAVKYIADFVYTQNGKTVVEDAKSPATRTEVYKIKKKLMLFKHKIIIKEV